MRDGALVQALAEQARRDDPENIVWVHSQRIRRISDVYCGDELSEPSKSTPAAITCKFTIRYWSTSSYTVAKMIKRNDSWEIDESLSVSREHR